MSVPSCLVTAVVGNVKGGVKQDAEARQKQKACVFVVVTGDKVQDQQATGERLNGEEDEYMCRKVVVRKWRHGDSRHSSEPCIGMAAAVTHKQREGA